MNNVNNIRFPSQKLEDFTADFDQLCNLCGCTQVEILPEVEFQDKKHVKSFCLSIYCISKECRNLSYNYMELDSKMTCEVDIQDFNPLPKGLRLACKLCGNSNIKIKVKLDQSGFKYVYDLARVSLQCSCGNCAEYDFLGKYFTSAGS